MSIPIPKVTKISSAIIRILGCNPGYMTLQGTNSYLLGSGPRRILIDTSESDMPEYINNLKDVLASERACIDNIIISHWHKDHIGSARDILSSVAPDCRVWKYERTDVQDLDDYDVPLNKLQNDQEFSVEGATLRVIHTPGHTTDHIVLWMIEENSVFSGDCILGEGTTVFENLYDYMQSLYKIQELDATAIYPGHGPIISDVNGCVNEYIKHRIRRENEILSLMMGESKDKKWTAKDIVRTIYKDKSEMLQKAAEWNMNAHLHKLLRENKIISVENGWKIRSNL